MELLPRDAWGDVVTHYKDIYPDSYNYTLQLRALEKALKEKPDDPAQRFLIGYHLAYLGFYRPALVQLDHAIELNPEDQTAKDLREETAERAARP